MVYKLTLFYFRNSENVKVYYRNVKNNTILFRNGFQLVARIAISDLQQNEKKRRSPKCISAERQHRLSKVSYSNDPLPIPKKLKKKGRFIIRFW